MEEDRLFNLEINEIFFLRISYAYITEQLLCLSCADPMYSKNPLILSQAHRNFGQLAVASSPLILSYVNAILVYEFTMYLTLMNCQYSSGKMIPSPPMNTMIILKIPANTSAYAFIPSS